MNEYVLDYDNGSFIPHIASLSFTSSKLVACFSWARWHS